MNGIETRVGHRAEVVRLDLLSKLGRQAAREYGVHIVPATLLLDGRGQVIFRQKGLPDADKISAIIENGLQR